MRHQVIIAFNDRTKVLRMFDETADHFRVIAGPEAEKFWLAIQRELKTSNNYPVTDRDFSDAVPGTASETESSRKKSQDPR